tara:strand:- start:396 stop:908 length:513 start_codon:yes stop_codon:yes gene_type:complete
MIYLGLGSNLPSSFGDRFTNINYAIELLKEKNIKIIKKSSYYETPSFPNNKHPKFINIVVKINTTINPRELASVIISIESKLERKRGKKNEPRTCDIDIIDFNNKVLNFKYNNLLFNVPHKKLIYRNFVLYPLLELNPRWRHPKSNVLIKDLIKNITDKDKKSILKIQKD